MAPGEEVALQPPLTKVFRKHLHHAAIGGEVVVGGQDFAGKGPVGSLENGVEAVGGRLVGAEQPEGLGVPPDDVPQEFPQDPGGLAGRRTGFRNLHRIVTEVGQQEIPQEQSPIRMGIGTHPPVALRG